MGKNVIHDGYILRSRTSYRLYYGHEYPENLDYSPPIAITEDFEDPCFDGKIDMESIAPFHITIIPLIVFERIK